MMGSPKVPKHQPKLHLIILSWSAQAFAELLDRKAYVSLTKVTLLKAPTVLL